MYQKLVFVTSFKGNDPNEAAAKQSWLDVGARVEEIAGSPPSIKSLLRLGLSTARSGDVICLINGDILVDKKIKDLMQINLQCGRTWAATSFRRELNGGMDNGVVDEGLDIFATTPNVASRIIQDIPEFLTIGRGLWDNWVNGWFHKNLAESNYFDITNWNCIFHPRHDRVPNRLSGYSQEQTEVILTHPKILAKGIPKTKFQ